MDYEKKYKEALERLKGLIEVTREDKCDITEEGIINIFPELADSEDERIRKCLIKGFQHYDKESKWGEFTTTEIISWLEKQGESYTKKSVEWSEEDDEYFLIQDAISGLQIAEDKLRKEGSIHLLESIKKSELWLKSLKPKSNQDCTRKEMIEKAKEFLYENFYEHPHCTGHICTDIDGLHDEDDAMDVLADSLEKAMMEE